MAHIVLIGAGQIGSRHLQSMAVLSSEHLISVVEPFQPSLTVAKQRWHEVASAYSPAANWYDSISQLPNQADVVIVATSAVNRLSVIQQLQSQLQFRFLILEKVLFQSIAQLQKAMQILADCQVFVNCPRRTYPFYRRLQQLVADEGAVSYCIDGQNWDMACNAIHHIDLWFFLSGVTRYKCDISGLDHQTIPSKRLGCLEVTGTLAGTAEDGSEFCFVSRAAQPERQYSSVIRTTNWQVNINEPKRVFELINLESRVIESGVLQVNMQSQLTAEVVNTLLVTGSCQLTAFEESVAVHYPFLVALETFFKQQDASLDRCPIT